MKKILKKFDRKDVYWAGIVLVLSLPVIFTFLNSGFPRTDDGSWMIIRFSAFYEAVREGQFPVRWLSRLNNGFGYPVANFLYPGFMYLGIPLKAIGFSFVETIKILFITSLLFSSLGMYFWLRTYAARLASLVGSVVYLYLPYHLYDVTVRGSLGEVLALGIVPFILLSLSKNWNKCAVILIGILIISHNTLALFYLPILFLYSWKSKNNLKNSVVIFVLGIFLATFFWLPALYDLQYTQFSKIKVSNPFEYFASLQLVGLTSIFILLLTSWMVKNKTLRGKIFGWFILFSLSLFFSSTLSMYFWNFIPSSTIQFPFRLLSLSLLSGSVLSCFLIEHFKKYRYFLASFIIIIAVGTNSYIVAKGYEYFDDSYYSTNGDTTTVQNEYMPRDAMTTPQNTPSSLFEVSNGDIISYTQNEKEKSAKVQMRTEGTVFLNQLYFPGWKVYQGDRESTILVVKGSGIMSTIVPQGESEISFRFEETPLRLFANGISLITLLCLFSLTFIKKVKHK